MNRIKEIINHKNESKHNFISLFFQLSSIYNLVDFRNEALYYIHRWFTVIAKTENFQQLDFNSVIKILSSSELNISSELEVFNASNFWLSCENFDRHKFIKKLFLKTRFPLLSDHVTKSLLERNQNSSNISSFHRSKECLLLINEILNNKKEFYRNESKYHQTNRYCSSKTFDTLLFRKYYQEVYSQDLYLFEATDFEKNKTYKNERNIVRAASISDKVYFLCNKDDELKLVRHSPYLNTWEDLDFYYERVISGYCMCSFVDSIFIVGGYYGFDIDDNMPCVVFDTNTEKWKKIAQLNDNRIDAASTVFEGRVVIAGGSYGYRYLATVEAYDHVADKWSYMPRMITGVKNNLITVSNKLFAFSRNINNCEVYDSVCKKFVFLKCQPTILDRYNRQAVSVGRTIMIFKEFLKGVAIYDVDKNEWSEESIEVTKNNMVFHCLKLPGLKF